MEEDIFSPSDFSKLVADLAEEKTIWVQLPVAIKQKEHARVTSHINIYLYTSDDLKETEEAYIRTDLYIASEKRLKRSFGKVFGLVIAEDLAVTDFLANAEVPSHLKWNGREEKVIERYSNVSQTLRIVRNSLPKLYELLKGLDPDHRDDVFADLLFVPLASGHKKGGIKPSSGKKKAKKKKPPVPLPRVNRYVELEDGLGIKIVPGKDHIQPENLPISGTLRIAYENVASAGNPFKHYHPFDFDLSESKKYTILSNNINIVLAEENKISFEITDANFTLEVSGFDQARQLRAKIALAVQ